MSFSSKQISQIIKIQLVKQYKVFSHQSWDQFQKKNIGFIMYKLFIGNSKINNNIVIINIYIALFFEITQRAISSDFN